MREQVPPHDIEAERNVIGAMLCDPTVIDDVALTLGESQFYAAAHRTLFTALVAMHGAGQCIDGATLATRLNETGKLDDIGGAGYIITVMQAVPHAAHWQFYAATVKDRSYRRAALEAGEHVARKAHDLHADQEEVLQAVESRINQLVESLSGSTGPVPLMQCLLEAVERIDAGKVQGRTTGFVDLDAITTGLHDGQLIVIAARPGVGKSAFAVSLAHQMGEHTPVLYASLEMSRLELAERLMSLDSGICLHALRGGTLSDDHRQQMIASANLLHDRQVWVDDTATMTALQIASVARLHRRRHNMGLLIVDYLQLISPGDERLPREQQISGMTRSLKCLAKSLRIPVIVLAQLNREIEKRNDKRPLLSDLRESGAIEQDADQVWMLHRPALGMDDTDPNFEVAKGRAEVYVRKNRSGRTGQCTLQFTAETMRFRNFAGPTYGMPSYPGSDF